VATDWIAWLNERGLDALGVLTSWKDMTKGKNGKHRREMVWVIRDDKELKGRLWKGLERSKELELERRRKEGTKYVAGMVEEAGDLKIRVYEQGNSQATRKVSAPLVKAIIEN